MELVDVFLKYAIDGIVPVDPGNCILGGQIFE